jgi:hypothetical protein
MHIVRTPAHTLPLRATIAKGLHQQNLITTKITKDGYDLNLDIQVLLPQRKPANNPSNAQLSYLFEGKLRAYCVYILVYF